MGNRASCFDGDDLPVDDNPLNKSEREAVLKKFNELCAADKSAEGIKARFLSEFESQEVPHFASVIYDACRDANNAASTPTFVLFQKFAIDMSRSTSSNIIRKLWFLVCNDASEVSGAPSRTSLFLRLVLECSLCECLHLAATADRMAEHLKHVSSSSCARNKLRDGGGGVASDFSAGVVDSETELAAFISWANEYAPHTAKVFVTYFNRKFFSHVEMQGGYKPFVPPLLDPEEASDVIKSACDFMPLALYDTNLQGRWKRLYTTQKDGLSFNRIAHHILGYDGPNIIIIRVAGSGMVLGAYNEESWRESNRFYGSSVSFLFTLLPHMQIFRSKANSNQSYQWLNLKSYGMPHGLGMGGDLEKFRLSIPDTLEGCKAYNNCLTFETGSFFLDYRSKPPGHEGISASASSAAGLGPDFDIDVMEVWGCGGEMCLQNALEAQAKDRGNRDALIQQARQVDKAQFANNSFDQEFLLGKTFAHKVRMADDACQRSPDAKVGKSGVASSVV